MRSLLKVHPADNVIVALTDLSKGQTVTYEGESFTLQDNIPQKHKFVTQDLAPGDSVMMYGVLVGKAIYAIPKGGLIHTHNLKHAAADYWGKQKEYSWTPPDVSKWQDRTFMGYVRPDGRVGTANYWLFVPTVFCENRNLEVIKEALTKELGYGQSEKYKNYKLHPPTGNHVSNGPVAGCYAEYRFVGTRRAFQYQTTVSQY
jgi:altronate hydrolase